MMNAALTGIGGALGGFVSGNPADAASQYYNQIPGELNGIYSPWINQGQAQYGNLNQYVQNGMNMGQGLSSQLSQMMANPGSYMNKIGQNFQQSPGYQWDVKQALSAANRASAANGMAGSPEEQQMLAQNVMGMANNDYYNYMNHAMNTLGMGLQGAQGMYGLGGNIGMNIYDTGANMANNYAQNLADAQMNQGNLAYAGQINQNQSLGGALGSLASMFTHL